MKNIAAIILGGGRGTRLYPLTQVRAKPAVPLAGKYRLIDIPMSNCLHSGIEKIYVLPNSTPPPLHRHLGQTYRFSPFFIRLCRSVADQQTRSVSIVSRNRGRRTPISFDPAGAGRVRLCHLSGDHLYRMDYSLLVDHHRRTKADITLSVIYAKEANAASSAFCAATTRPGDRVPGKAQRRGTQSHASAVAVAGPETSRPAAKALPRFMASMFSKKRSSSMLTETSAADRFSKGDDPIGVGSP
jgi:hypothetical protein